MFVRWEQIKRIHLIGICGTAMASLAGMLKALGFNVTGSDHNIYPPMSTLLQELGIPVFQGFSDSNLDSKPDLVIVGNAISRGNAELEAVLNRKLYYTSMPEVVKELFIRGKNSIVVAGTHGKTTTTSLLAWIFESAGLHPSFLIGGVAENFGSSFKLGSGEVFIIEGDEYDTAYFDKGPKFLHYLPDTVIFNNCEFDHADIYSDLEAVKLSFRRLVNIIPSQGKLIACWDDPVVRDISKNAFCQVVSFGLSDLPHWKADRIEVLETGTRFTLWRGQSVVDTMEIPLSGCFNVKNALAAIACAQSHGIDFETIRNAFRQFKNVKRRLELRYTINGITFFDDFAHHPTAIRETLTAVRGRFPQNRIWAIFEPRSATSRRNVFQQEFSQSFDCADRVVLASIYAPEKIPSNARLNVERLVADLRLRGIDARELAGAKEIVDWVTPQLKSRDIVIIMSNGGFDMIHERFLNALRTV